MSDELKELHEARTWLRRLPDAYPKLEDTRLFKLTRLLTAEFVELREVFEKIEIYRDVDEATGTTLDLLGRNILQLRGQTTDETYRALIKSKAARNLSRGDVNDVKEIVAGMLSIDPSEVTLAVLWERDPAEPAAVEVAAPMTPLATFNLTPEQFAAVVQLIVAGGVRASTLLQGTFQLSSVYDELETSDEKGLADLDQTTGGTLGEYYDVRNTPPLPF